MTLKIVLILATLILANACGASEDGARSSHIDTASVDQRENRKQAEGSQTFSKSLQDAAVTPIGGEKGQLQTVAALQAVQPLDRKIIRNADLTLQVDSPKEIQARISSVAESLAGFVVSSEFKQGIAPASVPTETVTVVIRVPYQNFDAALEAVRGIGAGRVVTERITGQDVTEEYIDLEARIRSQKALELQFLEIMKQARKVEDALEVQRQLAEVRNEIERLEGRRRFLDNKTSLYTITVTLQTSAPLVTATTTGFGHDVKTAFGDGIDTAVAIIVGLIRFVIISIPIALFILLPIGLIVRWLSRRFPRTPKTATVES